MVELAKGYLSRSCSDASGMGDAQNQIWVMQG